MRLSFLQLMIIVAALGNVHATVGNAQPALEKKLTLKLRNERVETIFRAIEAQTDIRFFFSRSVIRADRKVTVNVQNQPLYKVLDDMLTPLDLKYRLSDNLVIVSRIDRKEIPDKNSESSELETGGPPIDMEISGRVVDENGEGLPGVSIMVKGTQSGTASSSDGSFRLIVPNEKAILVFSYVGYVSQEVVIDGRTRLDVTMVVDEKALDEVIVVGYGTQKRRDLTGAVHRIDNVKNETLPNTNIIQALRGTVPGVRIAAGGNAGSGNTVTIRGQNSLSGNNNALIVVDGIIYGGQLGNLNPNDIASIEVLKDASSAAIFGAKSANGVILITTKKGTSAKPTIQFNSYAGTQDFLMTLDLETPEQYIQKKFDYQKTLAFRGVAPNPNLGNPIQYLNQDEIENFKQNRVIDPIKKITQPSPIQSYNLNIGAKTDRTSYYLAGSWTNQQGRVMGDQFKRTSLRVNLETEITRWLKIGTNSSFAFVDVSNPVANLANAFWLSPYATWYLDEKETILNPTPMTDGLVGNPLLPTLNKVTNQRKELFGIFYGEIDIPFIPGLTYRFTYSNHMINTKNYSFTPSFNAGGLNRVASASNAVTESQDMNVESLVKYNRDFNADHSLDVTFLYNYNFANNTTLTANSNTFPTDLLEFYGLSLGENQTTDAGYSDYRAIAMMGRVNYKFKNRYLLTLTGRRDGASVFSANNKFAFFPSMAVGWIISDEAFLESNNVIDLLKIRLSYGGNGNQGISRYGSLSRIVTGTGYNYLFDGNTAFGIAKTSMGNSNLKWETTYAANLGIDFELFKGRIGGNLNLYNSNTKDLIVSRRIPTLNGFSSVLSNLGSVNNRGIELMINTINIRKNDWEWSTGFNIAHNKNKITRLYGELDENGHELDDIANGWFIGKSVGAYYNYTIDGVYQIGDEIPSGFRPGDFKIKDLNGDGKITQDGDRSIIGYDVPKFTYGFHSQLNYKNFGLFIQLLGRQGGLRNNSGMLLPTSSWSFRVRDQHINWWTPDNPTNDHISLDYQNAHSVAILEDPSFLRVQDISLTYEFGKQFLDKLKINRLQLYVSAKNPLLFTKWRGWDPEMTGSGRGQYPSLKTWTGGINLSF